MTDPGAPPLLPPRILDLLSALERPARFIAGLGLTIYEAVLRTQEPRWPFLVLYSVMMGSPLVQRADEIRREVTHRGDR